MSDRCMEFREMNPGGREMVTSGGEREERRAGPGLMIEGRLIVIILSLLQFRF